MQVERAEKLGWGDTGNRAGLTRLTKGRCAARGVKEKGHTHTSKQKDRGALSTAGAEMYPHPWKRLRLLFSHT